MTKFEVIKLINEKPFRTTISLKKCKKTEFGTYILPKNYYSRVFYKNKGNLYWNSIPYLNVKRNQINPI